MTRPVKSCGHPVEPGHRPGEFAAVGSGSVAGDNPSNAWVGLPITGSFFWLMSALRRTTIDPHGFSKEKENASAPESTG